MQRRLLALAILVSLAACSGQSSGGGMLPSAPQQPAIAQPEQPEGSSAPEDSNETVVPGEAQRGVEAAQPIDDLSDAGLTPENGYYPMATPNAAHPMCPPTSRYAFRCFGWIRTDLVAIPRGDAIPFGVGYTPSDIQSAYSLNPKAGKGQTVAIVDAYGYARAASDLAIYRQAAKLPPCTVANRCLKILNQNGAAGPLPAQPPVTDTNAIGWVYEQSLDLDAVSAACPLCHITLIQASNPGTLSTAAATALRQSHIVSMSFGAPESGQSPNSGLPTHGYAIVASSGDFGGGNRPQAGGQGGPQIPCSWSTVVCAGGTRLTHRGASWTETVWNDEAKRACNGPCGATGSGCSRIVPKPAWQHDPGCRMRSSVDVSADASVYTPLAVYNSNFRPGGYSSNWGGIGGTSLSSPLIAAVFALAGNVLSRHGAMELWQKHNALRDVIKGTNVYIPVTGPCASSIRYICVAGRGYDGPTGWGSPKGTSNF